MKNNKIVAIFYLTCASILNLSAREEQTQKQSTVQLNPYAKSPLIFTAEDGTFGKFWIGNKKYPGKAYIGEDEYIDVISIRKNKLNTKLNKKLRNHKTKLGFYINPITDQEYYIYGKVVFLNTSKNNDGPDADVITQIAINNDYGMGE